MYHAVPVFIIKNLVRAAGMSRERCFELLEEVVGEREQKAATKLLRKYSDQDLTLTDAVGLHLMKAHRIKSCWSTDFHLGLTGVPLAIHDV